MGLFDFLSGKGGGLASKITAANNKYAQSADRYRALEKLRDEGSEEALIGLLRRFTWNYDKSIEDEQEKEAVHDWLVEMAGPAAPGDGHAGGDGEPERGGGVDAAQRARVLAAIARSAASSETISWQLRVLSHVASHDEAWPILEQVIAENDNEYVRDPSRKIQLVTFLGDSFAEERATRALVQWLADADETVRYNAVEALFHHKNEAVARDPLLARLLDEADESRRIKIRIVEVLAELGFDVEARKAEVESALASLGLALTVDAKGRLKKK